ncbi:MAG: hypothetical protein ACK5Z2_00265 [Bacteroidota bacterium]|jgi:hypothetical protein
MQRVFAFFIEAVFWMQLFLFPLFWATIPAVIIFNSSTESWAVPTAVGLLVAGAAIGIWLAERIRKKYGLCSAFFGRFLGR